jgi:maltooligosyltrehalose trehalohydrolase
MTALLLLGPATPMLFQGQELSAASPFLYFADFEDRSLAAAVQRGRAEFLTQFPSIVSYEAATALDDPGHVATFERCKIDRGNSETANAAFRLHQDLLRLRREEAAFAAQAPGAVDGSVLSASAFALRFFTPDHRDDRVLLVNLGADFLRCSIAEPLLAPPPGCDWTLHWSSEDPRYDGAGTPDPFPDEYWRVAGESAIVLAPGGCRPRPFGPKRRTA